MLANAFINSQFNYAPLVWMFSGKTSINKTCKIYYRTLQVIRNDYQKSYDELLILIMMSIYIKSTYIFWLLKLLKALRT